MPEELWPIPSRLNLPDGAALLAAKEPVRAAALGRKLLDDAKNRGDVVTQLQAYDLLEPSLGTDATAGRAQLYCAKCHARRQP